MSWIMEGPYMTVKRIIWRLNYFLRLSFRNIRRGLFLNLITIATITLALSIICGFLVLIHNLQNIAVGWGKKIQISAYIDGEVSGSRAKELMKKVKVIPGVEGTEFISSEDALKELMDYLGDKSNLLAGIEENPLPASLEISLKKTHRNSSGIESVVSNLERLGLFKEIDYGKKWVDKFSAIVGFIRFVGVVIGIFLSLAVVFIVSNTIKLTVMARREEIETLKLVGATDFFIKIPFFIEGLIQGLLGSVLSIALLFLLYKTLIPALPSSMLTEWGIQPISFLPIRYFSYIMVSGILFGIFGSEISLARFLKI